MKEMEEDFDGTIDIAEFITRLREEQKRFRAMDTDHDGEVTLEEYNAFVLTQRAAVDKRRSLQAKVGGGAAGKPGRRALFRTQKGMLPTAADQINERHKFRRDLAVSEKKLPPATVQVPSASAASESQTPAASQTSGSDNGGQQPRDPNAVYSERLALARPSLNPKLHPVDWGAPQPNNSNNVRFLRAVQEAGEEYAREIDMAGRAADRAVEASRRLEQLERRDEAAARIVNQRAERLGVENSIKTMFVKVSKSLSTLPVPSDISLNASTASLGADKLRLVPDNSALGKGYVLPVGHLTGPTHKRRADARARAQRRRAKVADASDLTDLDQFDKRGSHLRDYSVVSGPWPDGIQPSRATMGGGAPRAASVDVLS
eukprot:SAG31_NODE_931_length_10914_cov_5.629589_7_plen_374_part_00